MRGLSVISVISVGLYLLMGIEFLSHGKDGKDGNVMDFDTQSKFAPVPPLCLATSVAPFRRLMAYTS